MTRLMNLGPTQRHVLKLCRYAETEEQTITMLLLSDYLKVHEQTLRRRLERLQCWGLIEEFARSEPVRLTDRGRGLADQMIDLDRLFPAQTAAEDAA